MECGCDYTYTCQMHREMAELERQNAFIREQTDWIIDSLKKIAGHLKIELNKEPEEPKKEGYGYW